MEDKEITDKGLTKEIKLLKGFIKDEEIIERLVKDEGLLKGLIDNIELLKALTKDNDLLNYLTNNLDLLKWLVKNPNQLVRSIYIYIRNKKYLVSLLTTTSFCKNINESGLTLLSKKDDFTNPFKSIFQITTHFEKELNNENKRVMIYFLLVHNLTYLNCIKKTMGLLGKSTNPATAKYIIDSFLEKGVIEEATNDETYHFKKFILRFPLYYKTISNNRYKRGNLDSIQKMRLYKLTPVAREFFENQDLKLLPNIKKIIDENAKSYKVFKKSHKEIKIFNETTIEGRKQTVRKIFCEISHIYRWKDEGKEYNSAIKHYCKMFNEYYSDALTQEEYMEKLEFWKKNILDDSNLSIFIEKHHLPFKGSFENYQQNKSVENKDGC